MKLGMSIHFFLVGLIAINIPPCAANVLFSSTVQLKKLLITQKAVVNKLDKFIDAEETLIRLLKRFQIILQKEYILARASGHYYFGNPTNSFKFIKRLSVDVKYITNSLDIFGLANLTSILQFPTDDDLIGASQALIRLQRTYQLRAEDMSAGILRNITYGSPLSSGDCFALARILYDAGQHHYSNIWLGQALNKLNEYSGETEKVNRYTYESITDNYYEMSDIEGGVKRLDKIRATVIEDKPILESRQIWAEELAKHNINNQTSSDDKKISERGELKIFEELCHGGSQLTEYVKKRLKCKYDTAGHIYLKIAPFKVEEAYLDPDILIYHRVLSYAEIDHLKALALNKLEPSLVFSLDAKGNPVPSLSKFRISQVASIKDSDDRIAERVSRRAGHMSHLSVQFAESILMGIYGMGGYYAPHYDLVLENKTDEIYSHKNSQRIATILFYLSDEFHGGATVFTKLGVHVSPLKGSAVVWRNLLPSTEPDLRTLHGACPVLFGSKWVMNKWLRAVGQEFRAPCSL